MHIVAQVHGSNQGRHPLVVAAAEAAGAVWDTESRQWDLPGARTEGDCRTILAAVSALRVAADADADADRARRLARRAAPQPEGSTGRACTGRGDCRCFDCV